MTVEVEEGSSEEFDENESEGEEVDDDLDAEEVEDEDDGDGEVSLDDIVARLEAQLAERFDSIADRRVNALLKEIRKQQNPGEEPPAASRSESSDVRLARLAGREYLSDEIDKFVSADERKLAMDLLSLEIEAAVARGDDDEDEIGRAAADKVAERIRGARKMYETKTRTDLQRRGALRPKDGQARKAGSGTSQQSEYAKGAAIAARVRPSSND